MFTSINKAIVALIGAVVFLVSEFTALEPDFISEEMLQSVSSILTAILVYLIPDRFGGGDDKARDGKS